MVILFGSANTLTGTIWCQPWFGNDGNSNPQFAGGVPLPLPSGTLQRFVLRHSAPVVGVVTLSYELFLDGVSTGVVLNLAAASAGPVIDNTSVVAAVQGQFLQLRSIATGGSAAPRPVLTLDYLRA